jgi:hypothetical protein
MVVQIQFAFVFEKEAKEAKLGETCCANAAACGRQGFDQGEEEAKEEEEEEPAFACAFCTLLALRRKRDVVSLR